VTRDAEIVAALRPVFAGEVNRIAPELRAATADGRWEDVRVLAHRLVGTAGTVEEAGLVDAARSLEAAAACGAVSPEYLDAVLLAVDGALARSRAAAELGTAGRPVPGQARPVVVAIEDNPANLALLERVFAGIDGVELRTTASGVEGVELARSCSAALVLLDLQLPDVRGEWVLEALAGSTRVAVVSGDLDPEREADVRALGASDYVAKPFELAELRALVESARLGAGYAAASAASGRT